MTSTFPSQQLYWGRFQLGRESVSGEIIRAVTVVTCALVFYSIGVITEQRRKAVVTAVLVFLTGGVGR